MQNIARLDFLTHEEIERVRTRWRELKDTGRFAAEVEREVIAPSIARSAGVLVIRVDRELAHVRPARSPPSVPL